MIEEKARELDRIMVKTAIDFNDKALLPPEIIISVASGVALTFALSLAASKETAREAIISSIDMLLEQVPDEASQ